MENEAGPLHADLPRRSGRRGRRGRAHLQLGRGSGYAGGRNFGHLAYQVDDIYETCQRLMDAGVTINRPPRDGRMAFVRIARQHLDRAAAEGRRAGAGRALGVDAQHRRMVGWPRPPLPRSRRDRASDRSGADGRRGRSGAVRRRNAKAARSARCPAGCSRPSRCASRCAEVREQLSGPLNLNFFCHRMPADVDDCAWRALLQPYYDEYRRRARQRRRAAPAVRRGDVRGGRGAEARGRQLPLRPASETTLLDRVKRSGRDRHRQRDDGRGSALARSSAGVDAIIAQGFEAGGHTGRFLGRDPAEALGLFALAPAGRRRRLRPGDRCRRDRRRSRHRRGVHARRERRAARHRLSPHPGSADQRRPSRAARRGPNVVHEPHDRRPRARPAAAG